MCNEIVRNSVSSIFLDLKKNDVTFETPYLTPLEQKKQSKIWSSASSLDSIKFFDSKGIQLVCSGLTYQGALHFKGSSVAFMAQAKSFAFSPQKYSNTYATSRYGMEVLSSALVNLEKEIAVEAIKTVRASLYLAPSVVNGMGRLEKYYPSKKSPEGLRLVTVMQSNDCIRKIGFLVEDGLTPKLRVDELQINKHASNGFPVGSRWSNEDTHELVRAARLACLQFIQDVSMGLPKDFTLDNFHSMFVRKVEERVGEGQYAAYQNLPLFVSTLAAKPEVTKVKKLQQNAVRTYFQVPAQMKLLIGVAAQALGSKKRHCVEDPMSHNTQGLPYQGGGGQKLVISMEHKLGQQTGKVRFTYVCNGDDTWITVYVDTQSGGKWKRHVILLGLDVSAMDWSQRSDFSDNNIKQIAMLLRKIDEPAGLLWYTTMKSRLVAAWKTGVFRMSEGCPSGLWGVSEVNGMNTIENCRRLGEKMAAAGVGAWLDVSVVEAKIREIGIESGLEIRIESFAIIEASSLTEALKVSPFLYCGQYFHYSEDLKMVVCANDFNRGLSSLPWSKTEKTFLGKMAGETDATREVRVRDQQNEFKVKEALRLASMYMCLGIPLPQHVRAKDGLQKATLAVINKVLTDPDISEHTMHKFDSVLDIIMPDANLQGSFTEMKRDLATKGLKIGLESMRRMIQNNEDIFLWTSDKPQQAATRFELLWSGEPDELLFVGKVRGLGYKPSVVGHAAGAIRQNPLLSVNLGGMSPRPPPPPKKPPYQGGGPSYAPSKNERRHFQTGEREEYDNDNYDDLGPSDDDDRFEEMYE